MRGGKAEGLLVEMRSKALRARGYIGGESLISLEDSSLLITISTWADEASWGAWASSSPRQVIYKKIAPLMVSPEKVSIFRVISGSGT